MIGIDKEIKGAVLAITAVFFWGAAYVSKAEAALVFEDTFTTNTMADYSWGQWGGAGGSTWSSAGYVLMDGTRPSGWDMAGAYGEKQLPSIPSSGYARVGFNIIGSRGGQSRIFFSLKDSIANSTYSFVVTNTFYGSTGHTQGVEKIVSGSRVDREVGPGSVVSNGAYEMEMWWSDTNLKMDLNGINIVDLITSNTSTIDPDGFGFTSYRFDTQLDYIEIHTSPIPIPAALYLFCSAIVPLLALKRRARKTA